MQKRVLIIIINLISISSYALSADTSILKVEQITYSSGFDKSTNSFFFATKLKLINNSADTLYIIDKNEIVNSNNYNFKNFDSISNYLCPSGYSRLICRADYPFNNDQIFAIFYNSFLFENCKIDPFYYAVLLPFDNSEEPMLYHAKIENGYNNNFKIAYLRKNKLNILNLKLETPHQ